MMRPSRDVHVQRSGHGPTGCSNGQCRKTTADQPPFALSPVPTGPFYADSIGASAPSTWCMGGLTSRKEDRHDAG